MRVFSYYLSSSSIAYNFVKLQPYHIRKVANESSSLLQFSVSCQNACCQHNKSENQCGFLLVRKSLNFVISGMNDEYSLFHYSVPKNNYQDFI